MPKLKKSRRTTCKVCRQPLNEVSLKHGDPYCTTKCCKDDHGVPQHTAPSGTTVREPTC